MRVLLSVGDEVNAQNLPQKGRPFIMRGDRKLNPLSQVLSCQRRSTAALLPIGVKWCQIPRTAHDRSVLAISTRSDWSLPVTRQIRHYRCAHGSTPWLRTLASKVSLWCGSEHRPKHFN